MMKMQKILALIAPLLLFGFVAQSAQAMCYTIPHSSVQYSDYIAQGFEGDSTICPQVNNDHWIEVCVKPSSGGSDYTLCGSGYPLTTGQEFTHLNLQYNTAYDYRVRYRKNDGSLAVLTYGSLSGIARDGNDKLNCNNGYPMGHPLCS
jgi:hypothetical protein